MSAGNPQNLCVLILRALWVLLLLAQMLFLPWVWIGVSVGILGRSTIGTTSHALKSGVALAGTILFGGWLRNQIYKRGWIADAITPRAYLVGNVPLLSALAGIYFCTLPQAPFDPQSMPALGVSAMALAVFVVNYPSGTPLTPSVPPFVVSRP